MTRRAVLAIFSLFLSCGDNSNVDDGSDPAPAQPGPITNTARDASSGSAGSCTNGTNLTYENFGQVFMAKYCTACHSATLPVPRRIGAPPQVNFDNLKDVLQWRGHIQDRAVDLTKSTEPPSKNVPSSERKMFAEWINCGAPGKNNGP